MQINRNTKQCSRCGKYKNKSEFSKNSKMKSGLESFCKQCHSNYNSEWAKNHRKYVNATMKRYYKKLRFDVLFHYSNGTMKCSCCAESHIEFLTLDHIKGGGNKERKKFGGGSNRLFVHLRKIGFPKGYQVLCMSCNHSLGHYGYCPHQKEMILSK